MKRNRTLALTQTDESASRSFSLALAIAGFVAVVHLACTLLLCSGL